MLSPVLSKTNRALRCPCKYAISVHCLVKRHQRQDRGHLVPLDKRRDDRHDGHVQSDARSVTYEARWVRRWALGKCDFICINKNVVPY